MSFLKYTFFAFIVLVLSFDTTAQETSTQQITLRGKVVSNGRGVYNVSVTDGLSVVQTDKNGNYKLVSNSSTEFVYISIPSGYAVPMKHHVPYFFREIPKDTPQKYMLNFELNKLKDKEDKHTIIAWADPQVYFEEELAELKEGADDVKSLLQEFYSEIPSYGLVAGDVLGYIKDANLLYPSIKQLVADIGIPFFYVPGNHDLDFKSSTNDLSKSAYKRDFGPNYYSFNRGKVHYVMLDDNYFIPNTGKYKGFIDENQMNWLKQDLETIPKGSTVMVTMHIPTHSPEARRGEFEKELEHRVLQNREELYSLLKPFNVHIFSGHEHYLENYEISENIFEHVHTTLSGLFWMAPWSWDGSPRGYTVYEIDGENVKWYFKSIGSDRSHQFNAYPVGASTQKPDAVTANVWNYDPAWKVYWYENDVKKGEMAQFKGYDFSIVDYIKRNNQNFKHKGIGAIQTDHMFFAVPESKTSKIKIEVIDRFGKVYSQEISN